MVKRSFVALDSNMVIFFLMIRTVLNVSSGFKLFNNKVGRHGDVWDHASRVTRRTDVVRSEGKRRLEVCSCVFFQNRPSTLNILAKLQSLVVGRWSNAYGTPPSCSLLFVEVGRVDGRLQAVLVVPTQRGKLFITL